MNEKRIIGQTSLEVLELVEYLKAAKVDVLITYRQMSKTIGADVVVRRHILESARRILMREHRMVFGVVMSEGLRLLDAVEVVEMEPENRRKRIRTQAKLGIRSLTTVDYDKLPEDKKVQQNVGMAMLGGLHIATDRSSVKKLEKKVSQGNPDSGGLLKVIGWEKDD